MTVVAIIAGLALVMAALRDVVHELLHPAGNGPLAGRVMGALWRLFLSFGRGRQGVLSMAGPTIFVAVLAMWGSLLVLGWALVFWPFLPHDFRYASGLTPVAPGFPTAFADALYVSLLSLSTLGFGDVTPVETWLRVATTVEAFIGFALLTAGISWLLMLYPVLTRRRAFAARVHDLQSLEDATTAGIRARAPGSRTHLLDELAVQLTMLDADLMHSRISFYFHDADARIALSRALPVVDALTNALSADDDPSVRHAVAALRRALDAYGRRLAPLLRTGAATTAQVLDAYTRAHPHPRS